MKREIITGAAICLAALAASADASTFVAADAIHTNQVAGIRSLGLSPETRPLYASRYRVSGTNYVVLLQYPSIELFGTPYNIFVFERGRQLVAASEVTVSQDFFPWEVLELDLTAPSITVRFASPQPSQATQKKTIPLLSPAGFRSKKEQERKRALELIRKSEQAESTVPVKAAPSAPSTVR